MIVAPSRDPVAMIVAPSLDPVVMIVAPSLDPVVMIVAPSLDPVAMIVAPSLDPVVMIVAPSLDPVVMIVAPSLDPVVMIVAPSLDPVVMIVAPSLDPVVMIVAPSLDPVVMIVAPSLDPVVMKQELCDEDREKRRLAGGTEVVVCKGETILKDKEKRNVSVCVGCGSHITDQYIMQVSPDLCWHASCLKCADCEQYLDESCTCFVRDGKTYCKRDYVRLFGTKCSRCGLGFCREDVVMRPTKGTVFHLNCFRCIVCNKPLVTGDEFAIREDGLFCRADHDVIDRSVTASPCQDIGSPGSAYGGTNNNNSGLCNNNNNNNQNSHNNNNNNNTVGSGGKETENKKS
ncbi:insulin gene enhancer protein isl-1, partial [Biomphalaria glabrata]